MKRKLTKLDLEINALIELELQNPERREEFGTYHQYEKKGVQSIRGMTVEGFINAAREAQKLPDNAPAKLRFIRQARAALGASAAQRRAYAASSYQRTIENQIRQEGDNLIELRFQLDTLRAAGYKIAEVLTDFAGSNLYVINYNFPSAGLREYNNTHGHSLMMYRFWDYLSKTGKPLSPAGELAIMEERASRSTTKEYKGRTK